MRFGREAAAAAHGAVWDAADIIDRMRVPVDLWQALQRHACWIEPALVFEWTRLMRAYAFHQGRPLDEAAAAMTWSDLVCEVPLPRQIASAMLEAGQPVNCVWTGQRLSAGALDIDHCMPWSAWPCGDLWDLMPAHPAVNRNLKRDRMPSSAVLGAAAGRIQSCWESAYLRTAQVIRERFMDEAAASFPLLPPGGAEIGLERVFAGMEMQRVRLRRDEGVPEWDPGR